MKIGLCGNFPLDQLADELDGVIPDNEIIVGRPNALLREIGKPESGFIALDFCIVALFWEKIVPELFMYVPGDNSELILEKFTKACDELVAAMEKHRQTGSAKFLIFSPVITTFSSTGFLNRLLKPSPLELFYFCQMKFNEMCGQLPDVYPVDMEELAACIGKDSAFDPVNLYGSGQPFSDNMIKATALHIAGMIKQITGYPLKCLVLDLDNTLWGGVAGEVGTGNILLDDLGPGQAFKDLQKVIYNLYRQGVILAVCSKNNTCDALEIIELHPHMILRPDMISSFRINWDDKPSNVLGISEELGIGLDSMMFIDDDPAERQLMREVLPEVEILDMPSDPQYYCDTLKRCSRFRPLQITGDDLAKGSFYKQETRRRISRDLSANKEEYLIKSDIRVKIGKWNIETLPRIVQLINKTNQFNLTTFRYSQMEIENILLDNKNRLFHMQMKDCYGEYGIIAAALIRDNVVDTFVLSCRTFGRNAETAFLIYIMNLLKNAGYKNMYGRFIPSGKNSMTREFYGNSGFTMCKGPENGQLWEFDFNLPLPSSPRWISLDKYDRTVAGTEIV